MGVARHRRVGARAQLHQAQEMFTSMGAAAFAGGPAASCGATGGTARRRTAQACTDLTAQELQIARLARDGLSDPDIAARLFLSPRTVRYHLGKVFAKLCIRSRARLADAPLRGTALVRPSGP